MFRRCIFNLFRKPLGLPPIPDPPTIGQAERGVAHLSAEQLAGTGTGFTPPGTAGATSGAAAARGRRARRGVRRTDSGHSVRTLPVYSKEAGDEELVLVRRQSTGSVEEGSEEGEGERDMRERRRSSTGVLDRVVSLRRTGSTRSISSRRSARQQSGEGVSVQPTEERIEEDNLPSPASAPPTRIRPVSQFNLSERGWGEAPTYLEAMSSPLPSNPELTDPSKPIQTRATLRERTSSTFRGILSRTGLVPAQPAPVSYPNPYAHRSHSRRPSSSVSLLLQPQTSRPSSRVFDPITSAYPSPWTSTHSLGVISSPIPHSAMRASFETTDLPRAGLSEDQMRFLSSKEAVSLAGTRVGEVPTGKRRRGSSAAPSIGPGVGSRNVSGSGVFVGDMSRSTCGQDTGTANAGEVPPTWDQVDGERRRAEAAQGSTRADVLLHGAMELGRIGSGASESSEGGTSGQQATVPPPTPRPASAVQPTLSAAPSPNPPRLDIVNPTSESPSFASRLPHPHFARQGPPRQGS